VIINRKLSKNGAPPQVNRSMLIRNTTNVDKATKVKLPSKSKYAEKPNAGDGKDKGGTVEPKTDNFTLS